MGVIFSREGMERRNKALQEEVTRGQFFEVKELDKTGGKIFEADIDLIPSAEAITFPDITCTTLDGSEVSTHDVLGGKVTLVTVSLREFARPMVNTWTTHFHSKVGSNPHAQIVPLAFMEGYVYKLFKGLLMSGMKKNYTEEQKKGALVAFQSSEDFRRTFDMRNRLVGYAFLVDQNRKVRWRGVGYALIHEGKALTDCANKLLTVR
uniref:Uncharacterized protein n=1 Tax=Hemiselmis tepida TaxID=464990 RepID=A0A7S0YHH3_9CRYP|mmetsp:Transcript_10558/g.27427  ORF Transcript_10558/g.27427 Transcript_10558/m.27427 type:complete len:207 (+) Transcript_10558:144-764(+)